MSSWLTKVTVTGVSVLALGGLGAGAAFADTSTSDTPTSDTAATAAAGHHLRHPGEHDEFSIHTRHGELAIDLQRGVVTATTPSSITVRSQDGFTQTYDVTAATKIHKQKQVATEGQVQVGDRIGIAGTRDSQDLQARWVRDHGVKAAAGSSTTTPPTTPPSGAPITPSGS